MKKIAKYFFAALAVASAVSCAKELTDDFRPADKVQQGKSYTFTATMADTKSVIDEETLEILWSGDENNMEYITVLEPAATGITAKAITYSAEVNKYEPTSVANFSQDNEEAAGIVGNTVFAVYPAGDWRSFSNADSLGVAVTFATEQNAVAGTYDPKAPVAVAYNNNVAENQDLHFQNTSALLKLQLAPTTGKVNTITVYSLGGETLSGEILLMNKGGVPSMVPVKETAKSYVNLNFKEYEAGATYYIAVAPATLSQGIAIQFNHDEVQTFTVSGEIEIERGKVYDLGVFACDEPEDAWYLIGDYNVGNANTIKKTEFVEVEGKDLLVAKDVRIKELQGFKVYNPATGDTYYPEVRDLQTDEWFPLTKAAGYGYAIASNMVYDVYLDYVNENMTGIILVEAGAETPEFATLAESLYAFYNEIDMTNYYVNIEADAITIGYNYDEFVAATWANSDPSMEGKWGVERKITDFTVTPTGAMSGSITFSTVENWGPAYWMIQYSNCHRGSVVFKSQEMDLGIPAEGGENYWGIGGTVAWGDTWTVSDEEVLFAYPTPSGMFYAYAWNEETESGSGMIVNLDAENDLFTKGAEVMPEISDEDAEFYNFFGVNGTYCAVDFTADIKKIIPTDNTSGEIHLKSNGNYYMVNYTNYEFGNKIQLSSPSDIDGTPVLDEDGEIYEDWFGNTYEWNSLAGVDMTEPASVYEFADEIRFITCDVPAERPDPDTCDTPEGNTYTWVEDDIQYIIDFGNVNENAITIAYNYDQSAYVEENIPLEEIWWNPEYSGAWLSRSEVYTDYTIIPTSADSGIITFVQEVTGGGVMPLSEEEEIMYKYVRIEYSNLTSDSVMLYSPSQTDYVVYDTETGDPIMNLYDMPYTWEGTGLAATEDWVHYFPVEVELFVSDEEPTVIIDDFSAMSPDETQWMIYDTALSMSLMGAEFKTLFNIGAADYSAFGVGKPGKYINFAWPVSLQGGPEGLYSYMQTALLPTSEYEIVSGVEVEAEWGTYIDYYSGYIVVKSASSGEGVDAEVEESSIIIKYRNFNTNTGSCEFELSSLLPSANVDAEPLSEEEEPATTEVWFKAFKTTTKEFYL